VDHIKSPKIDEVELELGEIMRFARLLYALAASPASICSWVVLYAIPMVGGLIDDTMAVKFDRPDPSIVTDYGSGLNATQKQGFYHLSQGSEIMPWILLTAGRCRGP
jgi:hypothetical protein